jgi:flagellar hook-associated protein 2
MARNQSVFNELLATSSNANAVSVSIANQSQASASRDNPISVSVQQLAASQQNRGEALASREINNLGSSTHQFTMERDGNTYDFSVNVNLTDSNRTIQQRMADAINQRNTGVTAAVQFDERNNTSTLVLTSDGTGERNAFTISDVDGSGSLVSAMGISTATREAQDAVFMVNGEEHTHYSNEVNLGNGIRATLRETTAADVTVRTQRDTEAISGVVNDLVNSFNRMREAAGRYADRDMGARTLMQRLDSISGSNQSALRNIGIDRLRDGTLQIDNDRLARAIESGAAERLLANRQGFTNRLSQLGRTVENNPEQFVSPQNRLHLSEPPGGNNNDNDGERGPAVSVQPGRNPVNTRFENRRPGFNSEEVFSNDLDRNMFSIMMSRQNMRWNMVGMLFSAGI